MAKYDDTEFFWLKLKEDFFDEQTIRYIENIKPNGRDYAYFYLKLCVKSLKNNGLLIQKVGNKLIPYDDITLSEYTFTPIDTVRIAVPIFIELGLMEKLDNGALYMCEVENLIGKQSKGAFKKQQQRLKSSQTNISYSEQGVDKCPPKCPPELELELELELDVCVCQRGKKFKDETCKDCWYYRKQCKLPFYNQPRIDKQVVEIETEDVKSLETFFNKK